MAIHITPFTKSPSRQNPSTYSSDMDIRLSEENSRILEMNQQSDENNDYAITCETKAAEAALSALAAVSAANFQGTWTNQPTSIPQSWLYNGVIYAVLVAGTDSPDTTPSNWFALSDASSIQFAPDGDIESTNVQDAIVELRDDTDSKLDGKSPTGHTHTISTITDWPVEVTMTEVAYLDGLAGNAQAQIDLLESASFIKPHQGAPLFTKASASSVTIPLGTKVLVGTILISVTGSAYTLSINTTGVGALDTGTKIAGTDYYVYALEAGGFIVSANATNPTGYTTANSRKIGGFHYGVIPESFTAINNITSADATKIAGINAYSFWDLKYLPSCGDASGMFRAGSGKWYDIYLLNTDHHLYGTSAAGKTIAGGAATNGRNFPKIPLFYGGDGTTTYGTFTWFEAAEIGKAYGKELISYEEFGAIAYGVLEASSASTADTGVTQHLANYTSKFGMCMATGCQYIWSKDVFSDTSGTYVWTTNTEGRGSIYSVGNNPKSALFGGSRDVTVESGSRCSVWFYYLWGTSWDIGCRYACGHLERE